MHHQEFPPPQSLRDTIKCFWYNNREAVKGQPDFEVVPDGYAEIIFHFSDDLSIVQGGKLQPLPSPFMIGLLNQPVVFHTRNRLEIIAIRCFPWTVFDLLGLQPAKDGIRIFEHPVVMLQPVLQELVRAGKAGEAIAELTQYFLNSTAAGTGYNMLSKAGEVMTKTNGTMPVNKIANAAHSTVRTLERNFKRSSGYTVKDISGLMRFEQVRNRLWQDPECSLAALAHELGYTDQPHLSREFKRYSGTTPAKFARRAKKERPVIKDNFVVFVQG